MTIERFVDAHIHLWQLSHLRYPWLTPPFSDDGPNGSVEPIARDYLPADYLADAAGFNVVKAVHIDAGAHPDDAVAETRWLQGLGDETGLPNAIVAFAALNDPNIESVLAQHVRSRNVRGIRHILNWHPNPRISYTPNNLLEDPATASGYALLAKYDLSFDLQIYPVQMQQAFDLARKHADIPVMINHMGMPVDRDPDGLQLWRDGLKKLAQLPQVAIKISGMGFADRSWTTESMRPLILDAIDMFTPSRVMFASDFPTDRLFNSYARQLTTFDELTAKFSREERDAMFAANAERLYRI